ncbi:hypothetical protein C3432_25955 [Citrobacter amalonaticus]|uniref:cyclic-guanylate-specific phosphodiesterase n=1 Tax=Citrobacter amalonaticus TaxID=35703 RepID=A0A2S4RR96_CITAM|nr:EAL domain-containing protein [Citrobacter amalonaticus]POT54734.1 hypothetical protein C3432_25955 [Citrobacter amalonaticus]POT69942.1 hypothetical protein C3436_25750 [Citrobacter amalonaticus]POU61201.1 hypothetical protein C3430_24665 [Citrobacter amalonaticus]POV02555.1 hypothetical protein C3424_25995 [Citrobacter amalonaticus]
MIKSSQLLKNVIMTLVCGLSVWAFGLFIITAEVESKNNANDELVLNGTLQRIDQLLDVVSGSMDKAALLYNGVCGETGDLLTQLATFTPYSRSFSIADDKNIVCTSTSGEVSIPVGEYFQDGKVLSLSYGPIPQKVTMTVNLKRLFGQHYLIASIPTFYFDNDIVGRTDAEKLYIKIDSGYLSSSGKVSAQRPVREKERITSVQSEEYKYELFYSVVDERSCFKQLLSETTLFLMFMCAGPIVSFWVWRIVGKPQSLRTKFEVAIEKGEVRPYFQPQMSAMDEKIIGCEVLARWISHEDGIIPPNQFIPLAEESGLVVPMTRQLMAQVKTWLLPIQPSLPDGFHVSINFSSQHMMSDDIVDDCCNFLRGFKPNKIQLVVEITESELLNDNKRIKEVLGKLQSLGVLVAIDDFGTGYSNLSYLHDYKLDILKVDRKFISHLTPENAKDHLIASIIDISHKVDMKTVIEGVETEDQVASMKILNPTWLQGFYYGKPVPGNEFYDTWLR